MVAKRKAHQRSRFSKIARVGINTHPARFGGPPRPQHAGPRPGLLCTAGGCCPQPPAGCPLLPGGDSCALPDLNTFSGLSPWNSLDDLIRCRKTTLGLNKGLALLFGRSPEVRSFAILFTGPYQRATKPPGVTPWKERCQRVRSQSLESYPK